MIEIAIFQFSLKGKSLPQKQKTSFNRDVRSGEGYDYYMTPRAGVQTYPSYSHLAPKMLMEAAPLASAQCIAPDLANLRARGEGCSPGEF